MTVQETSFAFFILMCSVNLVSVSSQCVQNQKDLLLELRTNLTYDTSVSKLVHWNEFADCCLWDGVQCNFRGRVTGLDLSSEFASGDVSGLIGFDSLRSLNLAENYFDSALPAGFGMFANLSYLNLSNSGFSGPIPVDFSKLMRLVVLDLSSSPGLLYLENLNLRTLIQNFSLLEELHLDSVNISENGYDWCHAISSSVPALRVLSLPNAYLTGPFDSSLTKLQSLEIIRLEGNNFSSPFPDFLADFPNLRVLSMSFCDLSGTVPGKLFQLDSLQTIDLSNNVVLEGSLPEFSLNSSLENIRLSATNFSGSVPESIGRLKMLSRLELRGCNFSRLSPNSFANLTRLVYLDLSNNHFTGPVPSFNSLRSLTAIHLSGNRFSSQMTDSLWEGLDNLDYLDLRDNSLEGEIPAALFVLPSLTTLRVSNNRFNGSIRDLGNSSALSLNVLDLSGNDVEGMIPPFISNLYNLSTLSLASNKFTGSLDLAEFSKLNGLETLDLSDNNLSVHVRENVSVTSLFPRLNHLALVSCNLKRMPNLRNHSSLMTLDLSVNNMSGEIPNWIWDIGDGVLRVLNLSHNHFTDLQEPYRFRGLHFLDLHSNVLSGQVPVPPPSAGFVDLSSNNFSSFVPASFINPLTPLMFFSVANNMIAGVIPTSLCNASNLQVLDMSNNSLRGGIPSCLIGENLRVLNLRRNNLSGIIPDSFPARCLLETLDLSSNSLHGQVPVSLSTCGVIEVLNLGHNNFTDSFPCLNNLTQLRVLALRSNAFYGNINCLAANNTKPSLQIIDLASNNFSGILPANLFSSLKAMTGNGTQPHLDHLHYVSLVTHQVYYQDSVTLQENRPLQKILTIFTSIDLSDNHFEGVIPATVGGLDSLYVLNFSQNSVSGRIPASLGDLSTLGSLDLSFNDLGGEIPEELARLTFLSFLNVSYNHLAGRIPQGSQIQTFTESSFLGNEGLCGFPSIRNCESAVTPALPQPESEGEDDEFESDIFISAALGFIVGVGVVFAPLLFSEGWRKYYNKQLNRFVLLVFRPKNINWNEEW